MTSIRRYIGRRVAWVFLTLLSVGPSVVEGQTRDQLRGQAEEALSRMTPEEIERRLKDLGLTTEQATSRARTYGVTLEDYLVRVSQSTETGSEPARSEVRREVAPLPTTMAAVRETLSLHRSPVPGFIGRPGAEDLNAFGYHVFQLPPATFEPVQNIATPPSYVLGPGDEVTLTVWGETRLNITLTVNRDGNVLIPDAGPVYVTGQTVSQLRNRLLQRLTNVYSSLKNGAPDATTFLDVSLARLRTLQVFVLGEVVRPGAYAISSMGTVLHALYQAGGSTVGGTLRDIRVVRDGKVAAMTDLYDYLIRGSRAAEHRLQDGDVIFVPFAARRAAIAGPVLRPAIYELRKGETLAQLIEFAGGLRFDAFTERVHVQRYVPFQQRQDFEREVLDLDLNFNTAEELLASPFQLEDGDVLTLARSGDLPQNLVIVRGAVRHPGRFAWSQGLRIRDIIVAADSLDRAAFVERGTIYRLLPNLRREVFRFNPRRALEGIVTDNVLLRNEDIVEFYSESQFFPERVVTIAGEVRRPGAYPRHEGMTVADLVVMAGGLNEVAAREMWELSRIESTEVGRFTSGRKLRAADKYWIEGETAQILLNDLDHLVVPSEPRIGAQQMIKVTGMVMYPGEYALQFQGERISSVVSRAGGVKAGAYLDGARLVRVWRNAGMVPINFKDAIDRPGSFSDIELHAGDSIFVAQKDEVVYVRGEVYAPAAVLHKQGASLEYYLAQAGGATQEAESDDVYVTLPNGTRWQEGWWFLPDPEILPGSTVYMPRRIEREDKTLPLVRDTAAILASLAALAVAIIQVTK